MTEAEAAKEGNRAAEQGRINRREVELNPVQFRVGPAAWWLRGLLSRSFRAVIARSGFAARQLMFRTLAIWISGP